MSLVPLRIAQRRFRKEGSLDKLALECFQTGVPLYLGSHRIVDGSELLMADLNVLAVDLASTECISCKKVEARTASLPLKRSASHNSKSAGLLDGEVNCPHCNSKMMPVSLFDRVKAMYCTICRHCDFDPTIKNRVNAGSPSVDKVLEMNCTEQGNCEIRK
jgi:transcription elongation factor Elf1